MTKRHTAMQQILRRSKFIAIMMTVMLLALTDGRSAWAAGEDSSFISADTVVIGCTAGGGAAAFAAVLPLMTTAFGGVGVAITPAVVVAWTGIGCAVGVVSGAIAIGTAWGLETWNEMRGYPASAP